MWRAICACAASPSRLMSAKRRTCFAINPACSSPPWREIFAADAERKQDFAEAQARSEEHTSELQSLMRISYAVFCLKKKNKTTRRPNTHNSPQNKQYRAKASMNTHLSTFILRL